MSIRVKNDLENETSKLVKNLNTNNLEELNGFIKSNSIKIVI